jgi:hypothetical protein
MLAEAATVAEPKWLLASTTDRKNGPDLLSPPPHAGCWCSRDKRRPYVSLIWCARYQVMETGSDFGSEPTAGELPMNP